jgi:hypothetical protein
MDGPAPRRWWTGYMLNFHFADGTWGNRPISTTWALFGLICVAFELG